MRRKFPMKLFFPGRPPKTADRTEINYLLIRTRSLRNAIEELKKDSLPPHEPRYEIAIRSLSSIVDELQFMLEELDPMRN